MSKNKICRTCNSTSFDTSGDGSIVCTVCGSVLESSNIVSEVQFSESSTIMGNFVSSKSTRYRSLGRDSRELSLESARRKLEEISAPLKIRQHHVDSAQRSFELAMEHNFTKGRRTKLVVAACLYSVCRRERTPHLLIDFSEILQVNVFVLANTFLQLIKLLNLRLPIVDPSIYIQRFSQSLEFGDKTSAVATTANKLVARMKRDWLSVGRKPSGICGAALYMASKIHGFKRSLKEIIHVVKVGEITLIRRLDEFQKTPAATLKFDEFDSIDLEEECDPPSFVKNRRKEQRELERLDSLEYDEDEEEEELTVEGEELKQLEGNKNRKKKSSRNNKGKKNSNGKNSNGKKINVDDNSSTSSKSSKSSNNSNTTNTSNITNTTNNSNISNNKRKLSEINSKTTTNGKSEKKMKSTGGGDNSSDIDNQSENSQTITDEERELNDLTNEVERSIKDNEGLFNLDSQENIESFPSFFDDDTSLEEYLSQPLPSLSTGKFTYPVSTSSELVDPSVFEPTDNLDNLEEEEIDNYIESNKETVKKKEEIWMNLNKDWIIKNEEKLKEMEEDIKAGRPVKKRKSTTNVKKSAETAAKAAEEELKKRIRNTKLIEKFGLKVPLFEELTSSSSNNNLTNINNNNININNNNNNNNNKNVFNPTTTTTTTTKTSQSQQQKQPQESYYQPEPEPSGSLYAQRYMDNYDTYDNYDNDDY